MRAGKCALILVERCGKRQLLIFFHRPRSKWWEITCFCGRPRKNGTCVWLDSIELAPALAERAFLHHPKRRVRVRYRPADDARRLLG